ncbi:hypothetical protein ACFFOE_002021 [Klebsiella aerogenes]
MDYPPSATDYTVRALTVDLICDVSMKTTPDSTVMMTYDGKIDFTKVMGRSLITREGEAIEGEALNDIVVSSVVTFITNCATQVDDDFPVM